MSIHKTTRAVVVGLNFGRHHARVYRQLENVELTAVVDSSSAVAHEVAASLGCAAALSFEEVLSQPHLRPDIVSVVTPPDSHVALARRAIFAGIAVLVEKPLATRRVDAETLLANVRRTGGLLVPGYLERWSPAALILRDLLHRKQLGQIVQVRTARWGRSNRAVPHLGVAFDLAVHDLDLLSFLSGQPLKLRAARVSGGLPESCVQIVVAAESGWEGVVSACRLQETPRRIVSVHCERGTYILDLLENKLVEQASPGAPVKLLHSAGASYDKLLDQLVDFVTLARSGAPWPVEQLEGAVEIIGLIESALDSASPVEHLHDD